MCYYTDIMINFTKSGGYMDKIDKLIKLYESNSARKESALIELNLKLIKELVGKIAGAQDMIYLDKVVSTFCEVVEIQAGVISGLEGNIPSVSTEECIAMEQNPYMPPQGGFTDDTQIKKAFVNYLKYHMVKKNGERKSMADSTAYDYSSRIKVLWEACYTEWKRGMLDSRFSSLSECALQGSTFLNAYLNISVLEEYVRYKGNELKRIEAGDRTPYTAEELKDNPLNNMRNLSNSVAALAKFVEFKRSTEM